MPISFNQVPETTRVPFTYVEFDGSRAGAPVQQEHRILVIGQMTEAGTQKPLVPIRVTSPAKAKEYFGPGSMLHRMLEKLFQANSHTVAFAIAVEPFAGSAAKAGITITGKATESGSIQVLIAGRVLSIPVTREQTAQAVADLWVKKLNDISEMPVRAEVDKKTTRILFTCKEVGELGNELQISPFENNRIPNGLNLEMTPFAEGAGHPSVENVFKALKETQYHIIACPYLNSDNLGALEQELAYRFRPDRQIEGHAFTATKLKFADACTLASKRNSPHVSIMMAQGSPTPACEWSASLAGVASFYGNIDPARPFRTLELPGILPPEETQRLPFEEREGLLKEGISTYTVDQAGQVRIEKLISTYKWTEAGAPSTSYTSVNTMLTLSRLRYDFRNYFQMKYPRHKLAHDGGHFAAGQAIMTPSLAKAECIALFRQWEEQGLVQNIDQFKNDLVVEINAKNPSRLDFVLSPQLVNQLSILGAKVAFLF